MCDKIPYGNRSKATEAARNISKRTKDGYKAYWCNECSVWHLYSMKRKK